MMKATVYVLMNMYLKEPPAKKAKEEVLPVPEVEYKTVPCKKYWTVGHCELGPHCVYIHQVKTWPGESFYLKHLVKCY